MKAFLIVGGSVAALLLLFSLVSTVSLIYYDLNFPPEDHSLKMILMVVMILILAWAILSGFLFGIAHFQYPNPQDLPVGTPAHQDYTAKSNLAQQVFQIGGVVAMIMWIFTILMFRSGASPITMHVLNTNLIDPIQNFVTQRQQLQAASQQLSNANLSPAQMAQVQQLINQIKSQAPQAPQAAAGSARNPINL